MVCHARNGVRGLFVCAIYPSEPAHVRSFCAFLLLVKIRVCVLVECVYSNGIAGLVWSSVVVEIICLNMIGVWNCVAIIYTRTSNELSAQTISYLFK